MSRALILSVSSLLCLWSPAWAGSVEHREYSVTVNGKDAGHSTLVITQQDDGRTHVKGNVSVKFQKVLLPYTFQADLQEWWQGGRLVHLTATSVENGKKIEVAAKAEADRLVVQVGGQVRTVSADVWSNRSAF